VGGPAASALAARLREEVTTALDDDLNAPRAVAALFDFVREGNRLLDAGEAGAALLEAWRWAAGVLDVAATVERNLVIASGGPEGAAGEALAETPPAEGDPLPWAHGWAQKRLEAKKSRNFQLADEIRDRLKAHGFEIRDTKAGSEVVRVG
jgi:cysteinyl-tRNA synthetase